MPTLGVDAAIPIPVNALGPHAFVGRYGCNRNNPKCITASERLPERHRQ